MSGFSLFNQKKEALKQLPCSFKYKEANELGISLGQLRRLKEQGYLTLQKEINGSIWNKTSCIYHKLKKEKEM